MKLISRPVNRIFTFGCSFTHYAWSTWAEIVALDLDVPLYNYGQSGAGNQYITNMVVQANIEHKFVEDDLIIVSWTNVCREDRWRRGNWITPGNIYSQHLFDDKFIQEWADPLGYMIRDFATINLVQHLLDNSKCQYHMLSMCDIESQVDQSAKKLILLENDNITYKEIVKLYRVNLDSILPSFFKILWNNDIYHNKMIADCVLVGNKFSDGHPSPIEHFKFLQLIFTDHSFKDTTHRKVEQVQKNFINFILEMSTTRKKAFAIYEITNEELKKLRELTLINQSISVKKI